MSVLKSPSDFEKYFFLSNLIVQYRGRVCLLIGPSTLGFLKGKILRTFMFVLDFICGFKLVSFYDPSPPWFYKGGRIMSIVMKFLSLLVSRKKIRSYFTFIVKIGLTSV